MLPRFRCGVKIGFQRLARSVLQLRGCNSDDTTARRLALSAAFLAVERLVCSSARRALVVSRSFSDDALDYFTERLDPTFTRAALARVLHQAKRNKAFETSGGIGLAVDGSTVGWYASSGCSLCRPYRNADQEIAGYRHHMVLTTVVGTGLSLPFDVEPYGPGDSEYAAGQSLLRRVIARLSVRFAAYVVVDGEFATAPFLHTAGDLGLPIVARLKANLPELLAAAQRRFRSQAPKLTFRHGHDRVELWDADDFDPWETCVGKPYASCSTGSRNRTVSSLKRSGSPIPRPQKSAVGCCITEPRVDGRSRIKGLMTPKTATTSNISAIITATAC